MKLFLTPIILLAIYFANSSEINSKLPESACEIFSEVFKKEPWIKTVAIVKFKNNFDASVIDDLVKCLPIDITVVLIDVDKFKVDRRNIRKSHYVILLLDDINDLGQKVIIKCDLDFYFLLANKNLLAESSDHGQISDKSLISICLSRVLEVFIKDKSS